MDPRDSLKCANFSRNRVIEMGYACGKSGAHFGSSLSLIDILSVLYTCEYAPLIGDSKKPERNRFILSKGHGALGYFAILESCGFLSKKQTDSFEVNGSNFFAHAHKDLNNGVEYSGGSLGLGLPFCVGISLANKKMKFNSKIFVLVGDGECDEGIIWESLMAASNYNLENLTVIVDRNMMQSDGNKELIMDQKDLPSKFKSFGFDTYDINGHNHSEIKKSILAEHNKPKAIIANTKKGYGISFMQDNPDWHHGVLSEKKYLEAINELKS